MKRWDQMRRSERVQAITDFIGRRQTSGVMARMLKTTRFAIIGFSRRNGITLSPWIKRRPRPEEANSDLRVHVIDIGFVRSLRAKKYSWESIGKRLPERLTGYELRGIALKIDPSLGLVKAPATEKLAFIPPQERDTRDFTGIFCGDPLPERSALARKHGAA